MSERKPGMAVLASGSGTTTEALIHATQTGILDAEVRLVVYNNTDAGVVPRVERLNKQYGADTRLEHISGAKYPGGFTGKGEQTDQESEKILAAILEHDVETMITLGYLKKLRGALLDYKNILKINSHPGILPLTRGSVGIGAAQKVLDEGEPLTAHTMHYIEAEYDSGETIAEHLVPVMPGDTPESLFDAVQVTEKANVAVDIGRLLTRREDYLFSVH